MSEMWQLIRRRWQLVALIGGVVIILSGGWIISHLTTPQVSAPAVALSSSQKATHSTSAAANGYGRSSSGPVYVDVKGAVKRPGLYRVTASMRVADVINMAQGLQVQADEQRVNLAAKVADQQVIYVPAKGEQHAPVLSNSVPPASTPATGATTSAVSGSSTTATEPINLNQADVAALQQLSGVGQKKAEKIIAYRQQHGDFKSVDELKKVPGFGDKAVAKYKDRLVV